MNISRATIQNWNRLHPDVSRKLKRGANKSLSLRKFLPREYVTDAFSALPYAEQVLAVCARDRLSPAEAVYSAGMKLLSVHGIAEKKHVRKALEEYDLPCSPGIFALEPPSGERDLPGLIYQCLLTEGEKNRLGSYYTPASVTERMLKQDGPEDGLFLDPCCGSGAFLLAMHPRSPEQLWGCDRDPVAVMAAKINLLCRYAGVSFSPRIFCCDYLRKEEALPGSAELFRQRFDCIATNPPWGAEILREKKSFSESFSCFFSEAFSQLRPGGRIVFLFPESALNVRAHRAFRKMLLEKTRLKSVEFFENGFTGVMTKYAAVDADKKRPAPFFLLKKGNCTLVRDRADVLADRENRILFSGPAETEILKAVSAAKVYDLSSSVFALGIVTGNNRETVFSSPGPGMEPVFTGKDVEEYITKRPSRWLIFDRKKFQQTAKEEYYRAPEKLIYRFISRDPVFAYDTSRTLCLNSANILIPSLPGFSIRTVLAFLNSDLLRYFYCQSFRGMNVLKSALVQLPFPAITPEEDAEIGAMTERILQGDLTQKAALQQRIFRCYRLTGEQVARISCR